MEVSDALREEGQFFDNVLNYIAPQFYFHEDQQQEITTKFMKVCLSFLVALWDPIPHHN